MRVAAGHSGMGLSPMRRRAQIPECWGSHGINASGFHDRAASRATQLTPKNQQLHYPVKEGHLLHRPPVFESGGVEILRPLLDFNKDQLKQTCKTNSVEWEEDESNHDVSLTVRNTVRSLLLEPRLPEALQKPSLLRVAQQEQSDEFQKDQACSKIIEECEILLLDTRSSILIVRLPVEIASSTKISRSLRHTVAIRCLQVMARIVSPLEDVAAAKMAAVADRVFHDLTDSNVASQPHKEKYLAFTTCGVHFKRMPFQKKNKRASSAQSGEGKARLDEDFIWALSRQPFSEMLKPLAIPLISSSQSLPGVYASGPEVSCDTSNLHQPWSAWQLWDGRYWIRVRNNTFKPLVVRAWDSGELRAIKDNITGEKFNKFHKTLKAVAPDKIRWTLPVIAEAKNHKVGVEINNTDNSRTGSVITQPEAGEIKDDADLLGKILVFPTLGTVGWLDVLDEKGDRRLDWEVRYKHIELTSELKTHRPSFLRSWDDGGQGPVRCGIDPRS